MFFFFVCSASFPHTLSKYQYSFKQSCVSGHDTGELIMRHIEPFARRSVGTVIAGDFHLLGIVCINLWGLSYCLDSHGDMYLYCYVMWKWSTPEAVIKGILDENVDENIKLAKVYSIINLSNLSNKSFAISWSYTFNEISI